MMMIKNINTILLYCFVLLVFFCIMYYLFYSDQKLSFDDNLDSLENSIYNYNHKDNKDISNLYISNSNINSNSNKEKFESIQRNNIRYNIVNPPESSRTSSNVSATTSTSVLDIAGSGFRFSTGDITATAPTTATNSIPIVTPAWLQIDLGSTMNVAGIVTQGASDTNQTVFSNASVTGYTVSYSITRSGTPVWSRIDDGKIFAGNTTNVYNSIATQIDKAGVVFSRPVNASLIRIYPKTYINNPYIKVGVLVVNDIVTIANIAYVIHNGLIRKNDIVYKISNTPEENRLVSDSYSPTTNYNGIDPISSKLNTAGGWVAFDNSIETPRKWLEIDVGSVTTISGIITQPLGNLRIFDYGINILPVTTTPVTTTPVTTTPGVTTPVVTTPVTTSEYTEAERSIQIQLEAIRLLQLQLGRSNPTYPSIIENEGEFGPETMPNEGITLAEYLAIPASERTVKSLAMKNLNIACVTSYTVIYSTDYIDWFPVDDNNIFTGNTTKTSATYTDDKIGNLFVTPVLAQYIRIIPESFNGWIAMRAALLTIPDVLDRVVLPPPSLEPLPTAIPFASMGALLQESTIRGLASQSYNYSNASIYTSIYSNVSTNTIPASTFANVIARTKTTRPKTTKAPTTTRPILPGIYTEAEGQIYLQSLTDFNNYIINNQNNLVNILATIENAKLQTRENNKVLMDSITNLYYKQYLENINEVNATVYNQYNKMLNPKYKKPKE